MRINDNSGNNRVIANSDGVTVFNDSNNKAQINATGLHVTQSGARVALFGATTIVGSSTDKVTIGSSGITLRENNTICCWHMSMCT